MASLLSPEKHLGLPLAETGRSLPESVYVPRNYIWDSVDWANMCWSAVSLSGDLARGEVQLEAWMERYGY